VLMSLCVAGSHFSPFRPPSPPFFPQAYRVHRIISEIRPGLIAGRGRGGALPPTHVDRRHVGRHLNDLHRVKRTEGVGAFALGGQVRQETPQLLGLPVGDGLDEEGGAQGDHVLWWGGGREEGREGG